MLSPLIAHLDAILTFVRSAPLPELAALADTLPYIAARVRAHPRQWAIADGALRWLSPGFCHTRAFSPWLIPGDLLPRPASRFSVRSSKLKKVRFLYARNTEPWTCEPLRAAYAVRLSCLVSTLRRNSARKKSPSGIRGRINHWPFVLEIAR